ncbi:hypothetical protein GCM10020295_24760 [Streptomyces cinereospinus]
MNAAELSRMHDYHQAALHAVREGLLMLDGRYRVALINDGGRELLGVSGDVVGRPVADLDLPAPLTGALLASEPRVDEVHLTADRVLAVNTSPVSGGERQGTVVTLRDMTELQALMGELDSERGFTQALRSQAHEAANRLHTVVSLIELGRAEEAVGFATAELELAQALTDQVVAAVGEPVLAALLLGKTAQANERGVELVVSRDSRLDDGLLPPSLPARDLVTILGNLIDNAVDAAQGGVRARVTVTAYTRGGELVLRVADTGRGVDPGHAELVFQRGFSTKPSGPGGGRGLGLALVRQTAHRHGGRCPWRRRPAAGRSSRCGCRWRRASHPAPPARPREAAHDRGGADPGAGRRGRSRGRGRAREVRRAGARVRRGREGAHRRRGPAGAGTHAGGPAAAGSAPAGRARVAAGAVTAGGGAPRGRDSRDVGPGPGGGAGGVSLGVVQYVLKPFTFATLRDRLVRYAEFRGAAGEASGQDEVDRALAALRAPAPAALPKGLSAPTLERVTVTLRDCAGGMTAARVAEAVGISRITARRYLEHLVDAGRAARSPQYGTVGRPELRYRWVRGAVVSATGGRS